MARTRHTYVPEVKTEQGYAVAEAAPSHKAARPQNHQRAPTGTMNLFLRRRYLHFARGLCSLQARTRSAAGAGRTRVTRRVPATGFRASQRDVSHHAIVPR